MPTIAGCSGKTGYEKDYKEQRKHIRQWFTEELTDWLYIQPLIPFAVTLND